MAEKFSKLLDQFPVTPYLDNRDSLVEWTWFIHNEVNKSIEKPKISFPEFYTSYYDKYKPIEVSFLEKYKIIRKALHFVILVALLISVMYLYES